VLFARNISKEIARRDLQDGLNGIIQWSKETGFSVSAEKSIAMYIRRRKNKFEIDPTFHLDNEIIETINSHKILGVIIDDHLNWKRHVAYIKAKAMKKMNIIKCLSHKT
jgi:hypothetical protein